MRAVADTAPLVAAVDRNDRAHAIAVALVATLGRDLLVPAPVAVEVDYMLRKRFGAFAGERFLSALVRGEHSVAYLTSNSLRRAVTIDAHYADLNLGMVDASVMSIAEKRGLPILTFDFKHFRAAPPPDGGSWPLVVDEAQYAAATGS